MAKRKKKTGKSGAPMTTAQMLGSLLNTDLYRTIDIDRLGRIEISGKLLDHGKHQEHAEQEQRDRADVAGPPPVDVFAGQPPGIPRQQRQGAPDFPFEMQYGMREVMPEGR